MLNFHYTDTFIDKIKGKTFEDTVRNKLEELRFRIDLTEKIGTVSRFPNSIFVLKTTKPQTRTIIQQKSIEVDGENLTTFFVRDIITNQNFDHYWSKIAYPQIKKNQWLKNNPLPESECEKFRNSFQQNSNLLELKRTKPNEGMTSWLSDFKLKLKFDVYELEEWVKYATNISESSNMREQDIKVFGLLLSEIIAANTSLDHQSIVTNTYGIEINKVEKYGLGIIFSKIDTYSDGTIYVLFNGANISSQNEYWIKSLANIEQLADLIKSNSISEISKASLRAYPSWTISKDELWYNIQRNTENSNLSLLPEQVDFLKKFKFPTYINGQAGSGKSTMLYYLFANAFYYKSCEVIEGDLVFLTENKTLLDYTKKSIFNLLSDNSEFKLDFSIDDLDKCFYSFKNFLLNLIPEEDKSLFPKNKYLDFSEFKKIYEDTSKSQLSKNIIQKFSAEESWFAISTFFHGYSLEGTINSENYTDDVANKSQILTLEKIKGIETNVLPFYNKLLDEKGYWSKLSAIKWINKNIDVKKRFDVVFCDEAQDFCRVELNFILQLSKYMDFDLRNQEQVPIVFAGDANQTVNPTGFRVDEMTSMLHEQLKQIAGFDLQLNGDNQTVYSPKFNYRSSKAVVNLANFIQFYRKSNLGINVEFPQEAKQPEQIEGFNQNIFLPISSEIEEDLKKKLQNKVFIIPTDNQEKENYINSQDFFSTLNDLDIKTSVEAKGAEYKQVVIYGFGDYYLSENLDDFRKRYFFNKLYVAITRAQKELIIMDSENAYDSFWKLLTTDTIIDKNNVWESLNSIKDKVILYNPDSLLDDIQDSSKELTLENARKDKEQGLFGRNAGRLEIAAKNFYRGGNIQEYYICLGEAEKLRDNFAKAAEHFLNEKVGSDRWTLASDCYWEGELLSELIKLNGNLRNKKHNLRVAIAKIVKGNMPNGVEIRELYEKRTSVRELVNDITWRDKIIQEFIKTTNSITVSEQKKEWADILNEISKGSDIGLLNNLAMLYYDLHNYVQAIEIWDSLDNYDDNKDYINAKIKIARVDADYINELIWLAELAKFEQNGDKERIENQIQKIHQDNYNTENNNEQYHFTIYSILLKQNTGKNIDELIAIGKKTEKIASSQSLISFYEGTLNYENILKHRTLNNKIIEFVIERWAKANAKVQSFDIVQFNSNYEDLAKQLKLDFFPFELKEIEKIEDIITVIIPNSPEQFKDIEFSNFRKFKNLHITNLGQFNLIVGDNNVGKTSLLEAFLYCSDRKGLIERLALAYSERTNNFDFKETPSSFVNDFIEKNAKDKNFAIKIKENRRIWNDSISEKDVVEYLDTIRKLSYANSISSPFIAFGKGFGKELAQVYYDQIDKFKPIRQSFLENIRHFIPDIERISPDTENGIIGIEEKNSDVVAPLHQYGEGANKLFRILTQMTLQKGKKILIDEIDSGIHYSRFPDFWKIILKVAKENDIQVIATTHDMECIEHFIGILQEDEFESYHADSRVLTVRQLPDTSIKVYTREFVEFEYAIDNAIEIRGGKL